MEQIKYKNNLKALRIQHNLTQREVAALLGHKSQDRISRWEQGQSVPHIKNLMKLSEVFKVPMQELYL
ncbi:helix-turn-helix domain-containing protein [Flavobacterium sp. UBA6046]|jgi:transcriptional regulator with XRE-family HTH domain|uniref:helix-turn-helix domain-containing protein n=1 Tax=Flavobacterium sp. UBA6046 TaxID=1946552 RepID=UPI0039C88648